MLDRTRPRESMRNGGVRSLRGFASAATAAGLLLAASSSIAQAASPEVRDKPETLVFVRHGEKPKQGWGS